MRRWVSDEDCGILTREEERRLVERAHSGDVQARNQAVMGLWRLVMREARKIGKKFRMNPADLAHVGILHILGGFNKFKLSFGTRLSSFFMTGCIISMLRHAIENLSIIRIGEWVYHRRGNNPWAQQALRMRSIDRLREYGDTERADSGGLEDTKLEPIEVSAMRNEVKEILYAAIRKIPERQRQALVLRRIEGKSLENVGRELKITRERVRQIEARAWRRLSEEIDSTVLDY